MARKLLAYSCAVIILKNVDKVKITNSFVFIWSPYMLCVEQLLHMCYVGR
jgi:hypothetical protein